MLNFSGYFSTNSFARYLPPKDLKQLCRSRYLSHLGVPLGENRYSLCVQEILRVVHSPWVVHTSSTETTDDQVNTAISMWVE